MSREKAMKRKSLKPLKTRNRQKKKPLSFAGKPASPRMSRTSLGNWWGPPKAEICKPTGLEVPDALPGELERDWIKRLSDEVLAAILHPTGEGEPRTSVTL